MAAVVDESIQQTVLSGMSMAAAAAQESRTRRFDQLAGDTSAMWSAALVQPTMLSAEAIGVINRTRINPTPVQQNPSFTQPGGP